MNSSPLNSDESNDYLQIRVDPLFEPLKKLLEFYILGVGFVSMPAFQSAFLSVHPEIKPILDTYNGEVNLESDGHTYRASPGTFYVSIGRIMAVSIFDFLDASRYKNHFQNTDIYQFVKHIRNGSAHNNRFNFSAEDVANKPAKWRDKVIETSLIGKPVVPHFMNPITMLYLMSDITEMIEKFKQ